MIEGMVLKDCLDLGLVVALSLLLVSRPVAIGIQIELLVVDCAEDDNGVHMSIVGESSGQVNQRVALAASLSEIRLSLLIASTKSTHAVRTSAL